MDLGYTVNPRKLEHSFRRIHAGISYTLLYFLASAIGFSASAATSRHPLSDVQVAAGPSCFNMGVSEN